MKNILILLTVLLLPLTADGQDKPSFSAREMADVRVATPGLFAKSNHIYLHLDSLKDHEYAFPLPGGKVISAPDRLSGFYNITSFNQILEIVAIKCF